MAAVALAGCSADGDQSGGSSGEHTRAGSATVELAKVPVGGALAATIDDQPVVIAQPTEGRVVAFSAVCPHQGCVVKPSGDEFDCPCHGSRFDAATGKVLHGPATRGLTRLTASVDGGTVNVRP
ncbi:MAG TPA: Rieske (2Fe-2S) protein [Lacisediminihabitans sp.]|uniref:QcrA and Rieske domain-containing protein n=1 Tax=Lacisediminihabitans sp. TaxID=2787631 RepID=UPI002ED844FE